MSKKLKVGDSFEVVRVLEDGGYADTFQVGRDVLGISGRYFYDCVANHPDRTEATRAKLWSMSNDKVKPIGKLVVTSVKNTH